MSEAASARSSSGPDQAVTSIQTSQTFPVVLDRGGHVITWQIVNKHQVLNLFNVFESEFLQYFSSAKIEHTRLKNQTIFWLGPPMIVTPKPELSS